jgi:hypothetical protein
MNMIAGLARGLLVAGLLAAAACTQITPAPEQVHEARSGIVQPERKPLPDEASRDRAATPICKELKDCDPEKPRVPDGPCPGSGMCPLGHEEKRSLPPMVQSPTR